MSEVYVLDLHINPYFNYGEFYKNLYENQILQGTNIDVSVPDMRYYYVWG